MSAKICPQCGAFVGSTDRYCPICGRLLPAETASRLDRSEIAHRQHEDEQRIKQIGRLESQLASNEMLLRDTEKEKETADRKCIIGVVLFLLGVMMLSSITGEGLAAQAWRLPAWMSLVGGLITAGAMAVQSEEHRTRIETTRTQIIRDRGTLAELRARNG